MDNHYDVVILGTGAGGGTLAHTLAPYLYPPVTHEPRIQQLHDDLARRGLHPFPLPVGVRLDESDWDFGKDATDSALDVDCKAHDRDNLYVVDTSFFPSSSAVNPGLTAMANTIRVGERLAERLRVSLAPAVPKQMTGERVPSGASR